LLAAPPAGAGPGPAGAGAIGGTPPAGPPGPPPPAGGMGPGGRFRPPIGQCASAASCCGVLALTGTHLPSGRRYRCCPRPVLTCAVGLLAEYASGLYLGFGAGGPSTPGGNGIPGCCMLRFSECARTSTGTGCLA